MPPEIVDIRQFDAREFTPLLEAESRVWREDLRWDYTASARIISACLDEKRLSGYALVNRSQIKGYSFFFCEGQKGLIGNLFVEPDGATLSHAVLLLEGVIGALFNTPDLHRVEAQLPHFGLEDLAPCFHTRCFQGYLRRFMVISLTDRPRRSEPPRVRRPRRAPGDPLCSGDFSIERWERKHDREAAQLLLHAYQNHVDAIINDQYLSLEGTTRLLENVIHQRGCGQYLGTASLVAIHRSTRRLAGILAVTSVRPRTAHIPQVAVAKEFQASGLGSALLELSFQELARKGYQEVSLTVTDLNAGAVRLYERLGFETFRAFGAFVWNRG